MVGVPGRSKACNTCRKRKKKCDLQQPICANCIRGGFVCTGYSREMILIQVDQAGKGTYQQPNQQLVVPSSSKTASHSASPADRRYKDLNRVASELECFAGFQQLLTPEVTTTMTRSRTTATGQAPSYIAGWWGQVFKQAPDSDLVSAFHVGHAKRDPLLRTKGIELYGKSLSLLRRALEPSQLAKTSSARLDVEMAGYTLCLYEFFQQEFPQIDEQGSPADRFRKYYDRDQIRYSSRSEGPGHIGGMINLLQLQKPESFAHPIRHEIFVQLRQIWIPLCIELRTATFLGTEPWIHKPWKGLHKAYDDLLWDSIALFPSILQEWEAVKLAPQSPDADMRAAILKLRFNNLAADLDRWHNDLSTALSCFPRNPLTLEKAELLRLYIDTTAPEDLPEILYQYGLWYLLAWTLYWSACITLYSTLQNLYTYFPPTAAESVVSSPYSIGTYCLSIARAANYFLRPGRTGMLAEMGIRIPTAFVQKALADPVLRAMGDGKMVEAECVLEGIGRRELGPDLVVCGELGGVE